MLLPVNALVLLLLKPAAEGRVGVDPIVGSTRPSAVLGAWYY